MKIVVEDFRGRIPRRSEDLLPVSAATIATNLQIRSGELAPLRARTITYTPLGAGTKQSIYRWGQAFGNPSLEKWFSSTSLVHYVPGPIGGDATERTYYSGDGIPKMTYDPIADSGGGPYPTDSYTLGVPAPAARPTVAVIVTSGTITGATQTKPVTINDTGADHGLYDGYHVMITAVGGMTQVNDKLFEVKRVDGNDFNLYNRANGDPIDGTAYSAYTSGGTWTLDVTRQSLSSKQARAYVYTYVTALGEEGPPSLPSAVFTWGPGQDVQISGMSGNPAGDYQVTNKRIYRTDGGQYQFVAQIAVATATYTDAVRDADLGEVLQSLLWDAPPTNLNHLIGLPNGVMAGYATNQLCLSIPYQPHAWPTVYRAVTNHPLVAISNFGTTIVACTRGAAYVANGSDPASVTLEDLQIAQGCVAQRSIVSLGLSGVVFASPDGLVLVSGGGPEVVTDAFFAREDWQALKPESMHAYFHDRRYVCFYDTGTVQAGFIFDPTAEGYGIIDLDFYATGGFSDPLADALYLIVGGVIQRFDSPSGAQLTYTWKSKRFDTDEYACFSAAEVIAADYTNVTFKLYADGVLKHTQAVTSELPFRLPSGYLARHWHLELTGTSKVKRVAVAERMAELTN